MVKQGNFEFPAVRSGSRPAQTATLLESPIHFLYIVCSCLLLAPACTAVEDGCVPNAGYGKFYTIFYFPFHFVYRIITLQVWPIFLE